MGYVNKINIGSGTHLIEPTLYAIAGGTASAITASINGFEAVSGAIVYITMIDDNAANATLNINSGTARDIYYNDSKITAGKLASGRTYGFVYDGTSGSEKWILIGDALADHLHDDRYLTLTGGTLNGQLNITHTNNTGGELIIKQGNDNKLFVGVGSRNSNYGIYDYGNSKWMAYINSSGTLGIHDNDLTITDSGSVTVAKNFTVTTTFATRKVEYAIPASTYEAGWRRICTVGTLELYPSWFLSIEGTYNGYKPNSGLIMVTGGYQSIVPILLHARVEACPIVSYRLLRKSNTNSSFYLDVYIPEGTLSNVGTLKFYFWGNVSVSDIQTSLDINSSTGGSEFTLVSQGAGTMALTKNVLALTGGTLSGDLILGTGSSSHGATPKLIFQRATANDTYTDWRIQVGSTGVLTFSQNLSGTTNNTDVTILNLEPATTGNSLIAKLYPGVDNTYYLGTSSNKWANIYATNFVGNASTATSWAAAQKTKVNLATIYGTSTGESETTINGGQNTVQEIGVSGILNVANGGTGVDSLTDLRANLGLSQALRFIGITTTDMTNNTDTTNSYTGTPTITELNSYTPSVGDVVINSTNQDEWVCISTANSTYTWERLGSDTSYKIVQTPMTDTTEVGNTATQFVAKVTQTANGDITVTKSNLPITDNTVATPIENNDTTLPTMNTLYYGLPTINNAHNYTSNTTIYAPTTGGSTSGNPLIATGSTSTPSWYGGLVLAGTSSAWTSTFTGNSTILAQTGASNTRGSSSFILVNTADNNNSTNAVAIELQRKGNQSWQILNSQAGKLIFRNDYTTSVQSTYSQIALTLEPNTGDATFSGTIDATTITASSGFVGDVTGNASSATQVAATLANTTKTYLLGTSTAITATAANVSLIGDTAVYLTTTAGELSAVQYSWNISGTEKAYTIYDSSTDCINFVFV